MNEFNKSMQRVSLAGDHFMLCNFAKQNINHGKTNHTAG